MYYNILEVDKKGEFSGFSSHYSSGRFIGVDSIQVYIRTGGHGGGMTEIIDGKKKK